MLHNFITTNIFMWNCKNIFVPIHVSKTEFTLNNNLVVKYGKNVTALVYICAQYTY